MDRDSLKTGRIASGIVVTGLAFILITAAIVFGILQFPSEPIGLASGYGGSAATYSFLAFRKVGRFDPKIKDEDGPSDQTTGDNDDLEDETI